jgi:hypothetical protein
MPSQPPFDFFNMSSMQYAFRPNIVSAYQRLSLYKKKVVRKFLASANAPLIRLKDMLPPALLQSKNSSGCAL